MPQRWKGRRNRLVGVLVSWAGFGVRTLMLQPLAIILATFVLEDAATVGTAMAVQDGHVVLLTGLLALYAGIVLGDLGLYGLGRLAAHFASVRRWIPAQPAAQGRAWLERHVFKTVFVARFLPGVRLPTYTACGYLGASLSRFALAAVGATLIWTTLLFGVSLRVGQVLMDHLGIWRWAGAAGFGLTVVVAARVAGRLAARASAAR